ncbi:hypothetical protein WI604_07185 [Bradyrhizobium symbiodeficiens]|uniref:hypothetical protein n=1 Tax=Bradyrhizobium symbiodeficiens TaxID=1404367 RepID=UPI0030D02FDC
MPRDLQQLFVIGCWPYEPDKSGFALPVFAHPENASILLVQEIDEVDGMVRGFTRLIDTDLPLIAVHNAAPAAIGAPPVHAFLTDNGVAYAGTAIQLQSFLRDFAAKNPSRHATNLQIAELIGTGSEKKNARARMRNVVAQHAGANAAASFYAGALQTAMWNILIRGAKSEDIARRIIEARSRLNASIADGSLVVDLDAIAPDDRATIDVNELKTNILSEFELRPDTEAAPEPTREATSTDADAIQRRIMELIRRINNCPRQEERISILIDAILADLTIGLSALLQYSSDRAKFANWTLGQLRDLFLQPGLVESSLTSISANPIQPELFAAESGLKMRLRDFDAKLDPEAAIAALIPKLFTRQFPMSRGELLYYLSKHLAKWPQVNRAIQLSLKRTVSVYVHDWRAEIEMNLSSVGAD